MTPSQLVPSGSAGRLGTSRARDGKGAPEMGMPENGIAGDGSGAGRELESGSSLGVALLALLSLWALPLSPSPSYDEVLGG